MALKEYFVKCSGTPDGMKHKISKNIKVELDLNEESYLIVETCWAEFRSYGDGNFPPMDFTVDFMISCE